MSPPSRLGRAWLSLAWLALLVLAQAGCQPAPDDPEAQIRSRIQALEAAVEDRDAGAIEGLLATDFAGPQGMDRARARAYASVMLARYQDPGMTWTMEEVVIHGPERATTRLSVLLTGASRLPAIAGRARAMDVELGWRLDEGQWKVVSARWSEQGS